jgi:hypothetical protein
VAAIAEREHGLVTTAQLSETGIGRSGVSWRVAHGRLHRIHTGVYAVGHRRLSQHGEWMAAVLAAGEGAALSHVSAASLWEIWRRRTRGADVVAPRGRSVPGVRLRTYRRLDPRDLTVREGIPVTTVARMLVDLTDVLTRYQLANVIHEAAFRRLFDGEATRAAMERAQGRRRLHVLECAIADHERGSAGTRSGLEDRFLALIASAGLPEPLVNTPVRAGGRRIEVDFYWPEWGLCVELDGDGHARPRTRGEDQARDRALRAAGLEVLRVSGSELDRPGTVLGAIQRARSAARMPSARWPSSVQ